MKVELRPDDPPRLSCGQAVLDEVVVEGGGLVHFEMMSKRSGLLLVELPGGERLRVWFAAKKRRGLVVTGYVE